MVVVRGQAFAWPGLPYVPGLNDRLAGSAARIFSEVAKALIDDLERGMNKAH